MSKAAAGAAVLLSILLVTGCQNGATTPPAPVGTTAGPSGADPLDDIESTVDAVERDLDTDAAG